MPCRGCLGRGFLRWSVLGSRPAYSLSLSLARPSTFRLGTFTLFRPLCSSDPTVSVLTLLRWALLSVVSAPVVLRYVVLRYVVLRRLRLVPCYRLPYGCVVLYILTQDQVAVVAIARIYCDHRYRFRPQACVSATPTNARKHSDFTGRFWACAAGTPSGPPSSSAPGRLHGPPECFCRVLHCIFGLTSTHQSPVGLFDDGYDTSSNPSGDKIDRNKPSNDSQTEMNVPMMPRFVG